MLKRGSLAQDYSLCDSPYIKFWKMQMQYVMAKDRTGVAEGQGWKEKLTMKGNQDDLGLVRYLDCSSGYMHGYSCHSESNHT